MTFQFTNAFVDAFFYIYEKIYEEHSIRLKELHILKKTMRFKEFRPILRIIQNENCITEFYCDMLSLPSSFSNLFSRLNMLYLKNFNADNQFFQKLINEQCNLKKA